MKKAIKNFKKDIKSILGKINTIDINLPIENDTFFVLRANLVTK